MKNAQIGLWHDSLMSAKKLIPRVSAFAVRSSQVKVALATDTDRSKWQYLKWPEYSARMQEMEIMVDGGYERGAALQVWTYNRSPLTLLALSPMIAVGG